MRRWLLRRALQSLVTLVVALVILFLLMHILPGDPLSRVGEGRPLTLEQIQALRDRYGLDRPLLEQLWSFVVGLVRGDLGVSIEYARPVTGLLFERLPATLLLGGTVLLLNFTVGLWLGVRQAVRKDSPEDRWLTTLSLAGYATPSFWLGLVLAWLVGVHWRLLPPAGMRNPLLDAGGLAAAIDVARHLVLPAITLVRREHRGHHALPADGHAGGPPPSLYTDRPGQGAHRAARCSGTPGGTRYSRC